MNNKYLHVFYLLLFSITLSGFGFSQNVEDYFQLGKKYFKQGEYIKAKTKFSYVVAQNKMYYEAYTYRARCYIALNMADSALVDFDIALKRNENYLPALYYRARYYYQQKQYSKALKDLNIVINAKPNYTPAILLRADIYKRQNKIEMAFADYSVAINNGSKNPELFYNRSLYYTDKKDYRKALLDINKAIAFKNNEDIYYYQKGVILQLLARKNIAISAYSRCIVINLEYQDAYARRAFLFEEIGEYDKAIADNNFLISHFRLRTDTLFLHNANMSMLSNNWTLADRYFVKALSANPKSEEALLGRAKVYVKKGKSTTAISYLKRILRSNSKSYKAYLELGKIYFEKQNFELALKNLSNSIKIKESGEAYYYRASLYYSLKKESKACSDIRKAVKMGYRNAKKSEKIFCR